MPQTEYAIQLEHVTKTFGPVIANHDVTMNIRRGEILSLLGENGSGKTTLMNMIAGIYYPDGGQSSSTASRQISVPRAMPLPLALA